MSAYMVWKIVLPLEPCDIITSIPSASEMLTAQLQDGFIGVWFLADPLRKLELRRFRVVGTGHAFHANFCTFIGTVQDGPLVWHVFEVDR